MPELVELQKECEEQGVELLLLSLDVVLPRGSVDSARALQEFVEDRGWDARVALFDGDFQALSERFGVRSTPTTIAFDAAGERVDRAVGPPGLPGYRRMLKKALGD
ncbi:MAG TPA: thioredoxin [Planctomycetes bacterium]|nr:thioredoxin [Planctomycetota bacterium]